MRKPWRSLAVIVGVGVLACQLINSQVWAAETTANYSPCERIAGINASAKSTCDRCQSSGGFWTAIGCIPTDAVSATAALLDLLLGIGGFFVVAQILIGSFELLTSRGNPQALQKARERITNSVIALLFIVFSVSILEFVGVDVLHLPGFFDDSYNGSVPEIE